MHVTWDINVTIFGMDRLIDAIAAPKLTDADVRLLEQSLKKVERAAKRLSTLDAATPPAA